MRALPFEKVTFTDTSEAVFTLEYNVTQRTQRNTMRVAIYRVEAMVFCCARCSRPIRRLALRCVSVWTPLYMWNNAGLDVTIVRCQCFFLQTVLSYKWQVAQLSPRDRATRHAHVSWNHAKSHMFVELHLISPATCQWPSRSFKVMGNGTNR